jgi:sulfoxide reductase heme-binding subunit YedZ
VKNDPTIWLVARASGLVAYALLTASVVAGLILKARPFGRRLKGSTAMEIHRSLSMASLVALAVHGIALVLDRAVDIQIMDLLVPGTAPYRPLWTGFGVVAAELMVIVAFSFPLRKLIGMRMWRRLHWATYPIFLMAAVHGVQAGSDTHQTWAKVFYTGSLALVATAVTWRALARQGAPRRQTAGSTDATAPIPAVRPGR